MKMIQIMIARMKKIIKFLEKCKHLPITKVLTQFKMNTKHLISIASPSLKSKNSNLLFQR